MGYEFLYMIVALSIIITGMKAYTENTKYKASSYGQQSNRSFWKILNDQGARGEYRISQLLDESSLEKRLIFNAYIPKGKNDQTTEIDIIMITCKGIYVIENKNYSGWIFGNEKDQKWCETLKGKKYFFYNPIKQNRTHIKCLEQLLQIGEEKYTSLITFNRDANLKKVTVMSDNVYVVAYRDIKRYLKKENEKQDQFTRTQMEEIYNKLQPYTQVTDEIKENHIKTIKKRYTLK